MTNVYGGVCFVFSYYFVVGGRPRKESYKTTRAFRPRSFLLGMAAASLTGVLACFVCDLRVSVATFRFRGDFAEHSRKS